MTASSLRRRRFFLSLRPVPGFAECCPCGENVQRVKSYSFEPGKRTKKLLALCNTQNRTFLNSENVRSGVLQNKPRSLYVLPVHDTHNYIKKAVSSSKTALYQENTKPIIILVCRPLPCRQRRCRRRAFRISS